MQRYFDRTVPDAPAGEVTREEIYRRLNFPRGVDEPFRRPYIATNMVSTVDGKVVVGGPGTTRLIGSETDHYLMAKIEGQADGVLLGAGLVREDDPSYPEMTPERLARRKARGVRPYPVWAVVSTRGEFPTLPRMLAGGREHAVVFVSGTIDPARKALLEQTCRVFVAGDESVDPVLMGRILRDELDVRSMICLGGPGLNATMLAAGAADELFLTLAPRLQGGAAMPTMLEGRGYPPAALPTMELLSLYGDGSELYLRYKLPPATALQMAPLAAERRAETRLTPP